MVPQVDEQQAAMIAFGVDPPRQPNLLASLGCSQGATGMSTIGVHGINPTEGKRVIPPLRRNRIRGGTQARPASSSQAPGCIQAIRIKSLSKIPPKNP
jgi:hypothetical protein